MLEDVQVLATVAVSSLERSTKFYCDNLGLTADGGPSKEGEQILSAKGGSRLVLHEPLHEVSSHTAAAFEVGDLTAAVAKLRQNGVTFEDYDLPGLKTVDGIATSDSGKCAWFKDPDGNILAIFSQTSK